MRQGRGRSGALLTECWADTEFPEVIEKRTLNQPLSVVAEKLTEGRPQKEGWGAARTAGGRPAGHSMFNILLLQRGHDLDITHGQ